MGAETPSLEELELQRVLNIKRDELTEVAKEEGTDWLAPAAATESGTEQLYSALERQVQQPAFADTLARSMHEHELLEQAVAAQRQAAAAQQRQAAGAAGQQRQQQQGAPEEGSEVLAQDWWQLNGDGELRVEEQTGEYVVVEREHVVAALAAFIAEYIVSLPEAKGMEPRELQAAVVATIAELRKGRVRRLMDWGKTMYRLGAVGYAGFSAFSNPWVAKAFLAGLWTALRFLGRTFVPIPM